MSIRDDPYRRVSQWTFNAWKCVYVSNCTEQKYVLEKLDRVETFLAVAVEFTLVYLYEYRALFLLE